MNSEVQTLLVERDISDRYARMVRIYDSRDWDALGEVFAPDVMFDYADGDERCGIDLLRAKLISFLGECGPTHHMTGNLVVEVRGEGIAASRAYVRAMHQGRGDLAHLFCNMFGELHDEWRRKPEGWRIVNRRAVAGLVHGDIRALGAPTNLKV